MSLMGTKEIMEIIPHRQPFLLIDTIEELEPGKRAVGKKCVTYNEPFFAGHFPGEPVMPGVLIVEALAQTGAVAGIRDCQAERPNRDWNCKSNCKREGCSPGGAYLCGWAVNVPSKRLPFERRCSMQLGRCLAHCLRK